MSNPAMIFTDFMKDVEAHIESRISGLPKHEVQEISAYIANRAIVMVNDYMHSTYRVDKAEANRRLRQRFTDIKSEEATE